IRSTWWWAWWSRGGTAPPRRPPSSGECSRGCSGSPPAGPFGPDRPSIDGGDLMAQLDLATFPARAIHERTALRRIDPVLGASAIALALTGLAMIYSATNKTLTTLNENPGFYLKKQAVYLVVGLVTMAAAAIVDYRVAKVYAPFIYVGCVGLLLLVQTPLGRVAKGAQRAFQVAGFQLSRSLFTRLGLIALLAAYLSEIKGELDLRHVIRATSIAAVPMLLVFFQPDIGTTIILSAILVALLVASGAGAKYLV